ncbi:MAG: HNH endonuclease [Metamycoplasmataceae bacterium]
MSKEFKYKEIIDKEINTISKIHPLTGKKNKDEFIELFLNGINVDNNDIKRIEKCSGLFSVKIEGKNIYFYIEHVDGGGKNKLESIDPSVKVSIPFNNKIFQNIVIDNIVFIVNIYVPYKIIDNTLTLDYDNLIYLFMLPTEIFKAKGYRNIISNKLNKTTLKTNPSSRWVSLSKIKDSILNQELKINQRENVIVIPKKSIKNFINSKVKKEYETWKLEKLLISFVEDKNDSRKLLYISSARREFKIKLINSINPSKCQNIHHNIFHKTALRGSHILAVNKIVKDQGLSIKEKTNCISDINNGLLLCANCDSLFDKYKFTIVDNGLVQIKNNIKEVENVLGCKNGERIILVSDYDSRKKYLKFHAKTFRENN